MFEVSDGLVVGHEVTTSKSGCQDAPRGNSAPLYFVSRKEHHLSM